MALAGETAQKYLRLYPEAPTKQLARMLHDDHPLIFDDLELARNIVRYYRGAKGKAKRHNARPEFIRKTEDILKAKYNPFGLPEAVKDDWGPVALPVKKGRGIVIADLHIPYHDIEAITTTFNYALSQHSMEFVLIDGDLNDDYQLSRFEKNPERRNFKAELEDTKKFLDALNDAAPGAQIIIKWGNHDNRLDRYLRSKAPELFQLKEYIREDYLGIKERGITIIEHDVPIKVGKLNILHGHEIQNLSTVVNPARGTYLKTLECALIAHSHRTSQHTETSISGRLDTAWSIGCLCQLHPEYARVANKWNHGFAILEVDGDDFEVENKRIIKGMVR